MLNIIGLGLWSEKGLTIEGLLTCQKSDEIYIETYTSFWPGSIKKLEDLIGKKIKKLERFDLEDNLIEILEKAKSKEISILVPGDPLVATTHANILVEAKRNGIKVRIIHNSSIYSAVCETGLHLYKFGATVTIPFPERTKNQKPESLFQKIIENKKRDLHTLCLLDIYEKEKKYMSPNEGLEILLESRCVSKEDEVVVFCRGGSKTKSIFFDKIKNLLKIDFGSPPYVIIIPGKLHFTEKEFLDLFKSTRIK